MLFRGLGRIWDGFNVLETEKKELYKYDLRSDISNMLIEIKVRKDENIAVPDNFMEIFITPETLQSFS